jgi:hypothetical protein
VTLIARVAAIVDFAIGAAEEPGIPVATGSDPSRSRGPGYWKSTDAIAVSIRWPAASCAYDRIPM